MKHSHFLDQQHISETHKMAPETWGWLEYARFCLGNPRVGQWQLPAAGKGHGIYGHLPGVRPNLQGDWTDELVKTRKMVGSKYHGNRRILVDIIIEYCLYSCIEWAG